MTQHLQESRKRLHSGGNLVQRARAASAMLRHARPAPLHCLPLPSPHCRHPPSITCPQCVVLTKVWRQADTNFVSILNAVRFGNNSAAAQLAAQRRGPLPEHNGIKPTQVCSPPGGPGRIQRASSCMCF